MRKQLSALIKGAKNELLIYDPEVSDRSFVRQLVTTFQSDWEAPQQSKKQRVRVEPDPGGRVAKKIAKALTRELPRVQPLLETIVKETVGQQTEVKLDVKDVENTLKEAVKTVVKDVVRDAVAELLSNTRS